MPASWIDTHAHLFDERFREDLPAVIDRARAAGVVSVVAVGIDAATSQASLEIAARFASQVVAAVGIQPNHVAEAGPRDWDHIVQQAESRAHVSAIGETGLDRYWDKTPFPMQEEYFDRHLRLARRLGLPVVVHCRESEADVVRMLRVDFDRAGPVRGVMHSFTGSDSVASDCLAMGLDISFAGMATYKTAAEIRTVARMIPLDRILVETDCPYLAPVPMRGKRNEPAFVVHTGTLLAEDRGMPVEVFAAKTTENARRLFALSRAE